MKEINKVKTFNTFKFESYLKKLNFKNSLNIYYLNGIELNHEIVA